MNTLNDKKFTLKDATISGFIGSGGKLEWKIEILGKKMTWDGEKVEPRMYLEKYPWAFKNREELSNLEIKIESGSEFSENRILPGTKMCCLYVFEHHFLDQNVINLSKDAQGNLCITWDAYCTSQKIAIHVEDKIEFLGINLGRMDQEMAQDFLGIDMKGLAFYQNGGVNYLVPEEWIED